MDTVWNITNRSHSETGWNVRAKVTLPIISNPNVVITYHPSYLTKLTLLKDCGCGSKNQNF